MKCLSEVRARRGLQRPARGFAPDFSEFPRERRLAMIRINIFVTVVKIDANKKLVIVKQ